MHPILSRLAGPALLLACLPAVLRAQIKPSEISPAEATELPYRESGKLTVEFGNRMYFGTATYIRRYTGLTAGHLLFDPVGGLAASLLFQPGYYYGSATNQQVASFYVLSGYQAAAEADPDSDAAFAQDMGYMLLRDPSPLNEWAAWTSDPSDLVQGTSFLALGYAAESYSGEQLAYVRTGVPYAEDVGAEYQNVSFYTQDGMSGGPVYATANAVTAIAAVNVAGTSPPDPPESAARAITAAERSLLIDAEYIAGDITGATLKGPATVAAGGTAVLRAGVIFKDGAEEGTNFPRSYDELIIKPKGSLKQSISVAPISPGKFQVTFDSSLKKGTQVVFRLFRDTSAARTQTPLQSLTVTIK